MTSLVAPTTEIAPKPLILVVEDNVVLQELAKKILKLFFEVVIASNGQEAVDKWTKASNSGRPFSAILMDIEMPVQDGFEATAEIRRLEVEKAEEKEEGTSSTQSQVPIIAYTGLITANHYLNSSPFSDKELNEAGLDRTTDTGKANAGKFKTAGFTAILGKRANFLILENVVRKALGMPERVSYSQPVSPMLPRSTHGKGRSTVVSAPPTATEIAGRGHLITPTPSSRSTLTATAEEKRARRMAFLTMQNGGSACLLPVSPAASDSTEADELKALSLSGNDMEE